jgi:hypothetical protein
MQDSPLPLIETILFFGFVIWLFFWQQRPRSDDRAERHEARDDSDEVEPKDP